MLQKTKILLLGLFFTTILTAGNGVKNYDKIYKEIEKQLLEKTETFDGRWPEYTVNGEWQYREKVNWLSGFAAGELWLMNDVTGSDGLKEEAVKLSDTLLEYAGIDYTHDMGFIFMPSVVEAYKRTGEAKYREAGLKAAEMLAKRFNKNGNFIRAWGKLGSENKAGWIIIDTMMNLELLFWAADEAGIPEYYDIAYKHALTTLKEIVRDDYSSFHVVEFNPESGDVITKRTHQGYADSSTWARGEAWGIYGFAQVYQHTGDERFLTASAKMADYFINKLPDDLIPYWDLDLSGDDVLRDASAAAVAASGMYILSESEISADDYGKYRCYADKITESLIENYTFLNSERDKEEGILLHTIYNYHKDWGMDESFPCGDYYFIEALHKYNERNAGIVIKEDSPRTRVNLNKNWLYLEYNTPFESLAKAAVKWERIDLPHSWNKFDAVDQEPGYRRDASWYKKTINLSEISDDKKYLLDFEGSNIKTYVYVNGEKAGEHIGGYVGFKIDITDYVEAGSNEIYVKVDNSIDREVIPSQKSDFFIYGGINRDVWLDVVPAEYLNTLHITLDKVTKEAADLKVEFNADKVPAGSEVIIKVYDKENDVVVEKTITAEKSNAINLPEIEDPELWSVDRPYLYTVEVELVNDGKVIDKIYDKTGLRWYEFKEHGAFYLNGERVKLCGTHRHEDHAGLANAIPNELQIRDMQQIKDMGANFVRLAHYPQDPVVYRACDELGILVWDELPWCRGGVGNQEWKDNALRLFEEQITQNYNHPSIILWSVGNEVDWLPDFEGGGDTELNTEFVRELHNLAHKLDSTRLTSIRKFYEADHVVDVFSPSTWAGWYSGVYKSYEKAVRSALKKYTRYFHAEYGGSSHLGRHTENPITGDGELNPDEWSEAVNQVKVKNIAKIGDWSENYIVDLFDWHLMVSESIDEFTGNAQWAFKDFGTPLRPENSLPYMNQKGLLDREGNPKDAYYVFKAYWNKEDKFVYIESHTWQDRYGREGEAREVSVYSNCDEVELFLNGKSLGKKERKFGEFPAMGLNWQVNFAAGENKLEAIGYSSDGEVNDNTELTYHTQKPGQPEEIVLSAERLPNSNYLVKAVVVDKDGNLCPDFNDRVYFTAEGNGHLYENYGTYTKSSVMEFASGKAAIEFKAVPFERCVIEARTQDFKGSYLVIEE